TTSNITVSFIPFTTLKSFIAFIASSKLEDAIPITLTPSRFLTLFKDNSNSPVPAYRSSIKIVGKPLLFMADRIIKGLGVKNVLVLAALTMGIRNHEVI
ncbi:MAG: hypothetical protein QXL89_09140, partial [Nitrososphaeria archaeon]